MRREFRLEIVGTIIDSDEALSTSELLDNLDNIVQNAKANGLFTGNSYVEAHYLDHNITIDTVED